MRLNAYGAPALPDISFGIHPWEYYHNTFHFAMDDISDYISKRKPKDPPRDPDEKFGEDLED